MDLGDAEYEPDVRTGEVPIALTGTLTVELAPATKAPAVAAGDKVTVYRYDSTAALPRDTSDLESTAAHATTLTVTDQDVQNGALTFVDPDTFSSDSAAYYVAAVAA